MPDGLPDWLILGAPKCGTTTLADWLDRHPGCYLVPGKESRFFNLHYAKGLDHYRAEFATAPPGVRLGDATPMYLYSELALSRIRDTLPDARLLVVLREPVGRFWSNYWFAKTLGVEGRSVRQVLRDDERGRGRGAMGSGGSYLELGRYAKYLERVVDHFPREQLHVVLSDDLRDDPVATFAEVCRHLGVDDAVTPPSQERNLGRAPRLFVVMRALRLARADSWPFGLGRRAMQANLRAGSYPTIDPRLADRLAQHYAADNERLASWLGRELPASWSPARP